MQPRGRHNRSANVANENIPRYATDSTDHLVREITGTGCVDHIVYAHSQWETTLHCNVVSHLLNAYTKWSLTECGEYLSNALRLFILWFSNCET